MPIKFRIFFVSIAVLLISAGCNSGTADNSNNSGQAQSQSSSQAASPQNSGSAVNSYGFVVPISGGLSRVTKKFFGTYVTPTNSPVYPERFTGFHTGIDFETTPAEQNTDVPVHAACSGTLKLKEYASGYGGVAVQSCTLSDQAVTVIYGHLRFSSINAATGAQLSAGDKLGVLGTGYSTETDGERKHLHFGIHKGSAINILGYVQSKSQLSGWIDPTTVLR